MKNIAIICGTRPEIIKLAPIVFRLRESTQLRPIIIFTGQHKEMAEQAFQIFQLQPDINLGLMKKDQTPNSFLGELLLALEKVFRENSFAAVLVQGDTTSALGGALAAFHFGIPVGHVEAGLRTYSLQSPFPEEMNRTVISVVTTYHFAPTARALSNLAEEGYKENVFLVGNSIVDALNLVTQRLEQNAKLVDDKAIQIVASGRKLILVTGHRRENFDVPLKNLCLVIRKLVEKMNDIEVVYPVHLNPHVQLPVYQQLKDTNRVHLIEPVDYPTTLYLMKHAALIISDSGGIQEEAPSFKKFVLVTRTTTERLEAIEAGFARLTPLDRPEELLQFAQEELTRPTPREFPQTNPFGDGTTAKQIKEHLERLRP